jgi:hypothetical protein
MVNTPAQIAANPKHILAIAASLVNWDRSQWADFRLNHATRVLLWQSRPAPRSQGLKVLTGLPSAHMEPISGVLLRRPLL